MIVFTASETDVNKYLSQFGLNIKDNVLTGSPLSRLTYDEVFNSEYSNANIQHTYSKLVWAYKNTTFDGVNIAMYIGNLPSCIVDDFKDGGFEINFYNVLLIKEFKYELHAKLLDMLEEAIAVNTFILKLLREWPKRDVVLQPTRRGADGEIKDMAWFEWYNGATIFHVNIPVPIINTRPIYFNRTILVMVDKTTNCKLFKYVVRIGDYEPIYSNSVPTKNDIDDMLLMSRTWWYKSILKLREKLC